MQLFIRKYLDVSILFHFFYIMKIIKSLKEFGLLITDFLLGNILVGKEIMRAGEGKVTAGQDF